MTNKPISIPRLSRSELLKRLGEVKANQRRLNECKRHHFTYSTVQLGQPIQCDNCKGTMQLTDAGQYVKGYMAAGGDPNDVWPGWFERAGTRGS